MRGVTLLELILVLVIMGVLAGVGFYAMRPNYLSKDTDYVVMQLQKIRYEAIGYDKSLADLGSLERKVGCFRLSDLNDTNGTNYRFRSTLSWAYGQTTFCFDRLGRLYSFDSGQYRSDPVEISVKYNDNERNVTIYPQTGYIER